MNKQILLLKVDTSRMDCVTAGVKHADFIKTELLRQLSDEVKEQIEIVTIPSYLNDFTNVSLITTINISKEKNFNYDNAKSTIKNLK